jgi:hypothetical protein
MVIELPYIATFQRTYLFQTLNLKSKLLSSAKSKISLSNDLYNFF